jgi:mannose/cellobiose epimerase-like protein (N-acyl-D-glucosamine 2-epimerase family)
MTLQQALALVREKYREEEQGLTGGLTADRYRRACQDYPAMMITAHYHCAAELAGRGAAEALAREERIPVPARG